MLSFSKCNLVIYLISMFPMFYFMTWVNYVCGCAETCKTWTATGRLCSWLIRSRMPSVTMTIIVRLILIGTHKKTRNFLVSLVTNRPAPHLSKPHSHLQHSRGKKVLHLFIHHEDAISPYSVVTVYHWIFINGYLLTLQHTMLWAKHLTFYNSAFGVIFD